MMYLAIAPQVRLLVSAKRQPLKNDSINPSRRQGGRFLMSGVGTQQGLGGRSIGPK